MSNCLPFVEKRKRNFLPRSSHIIGSYSYVRIGPKPVVSHGIVDIAHQVLENVLVGDSKRLNFH